MTRESKLALIIGFVLVLVVGVLVSDHFSQASTMSLDVQQPEDTGIVVPITQLGSREQPSEQGKQGRGQRSSQRALARNGFANGESQQRQQSPVMISNGRRSQTDGSSSTKGSLIDRAFNEARNRVQGTQLPSARIASSSETSPGASSGTSSTTSGWAPKSLPDARRAGQYASYKVVSGDTLIGIARRQLGNGERWRQIHALNADVLGPDAILKIGMRLKLPGDAKANAKRSNNTQASRPASSGKAYTVVSGDTLGQISYRLLGTSKRVGEFVKLNGLDDADDIRVGMTLKVPVK